MKASRTAAVSLTALVGLLVVGCGEEAEDAVGTGQGPAMRMNVAVCIAEDADVSASAVVEIRQDGRSVGTIADPARPTWIEVTTASGTIEVASDGQVLQEQTGEPGDRLLFSLGDCTPPSATSR